MDGKPAYLCAYIRTPIGRFGGALASVRPDDMGAHVIQALLQQTPGIDAARIDEVFFGCANQAGEDNRNVARMSALLAGLPTDVPAMTINRLCGSGMDAVIQAARGIACGAIDLAIAGGTESMSRAPFVMPKAESAYARTAKIEDTTLGWRFVNPVMHAMHGTDTMPETAENVAEEFQIWREDQDAFALRSQKRAASAIARGRFVREIAPVEVKRRKGDPVRVDADEHPRLTSMEKLSSLPTPFRDGGSVTAGNASGVNDGAAALLLASEDAVEAFGLTPIARICGGATAGLPPRIMGFGPAPASRKLLDKLGWGIGDVDVIELNEAFASQALAVTRDLGLPDDAEHVNPNGGAIALGHPLGMSGARITGTLALELQDRGAKRGLATMCIGVGQGIAVALEAV